MFKLYDIVKLKKADSLVGVSETDTGVIVICSGDHPQHRWDLDKDLSLHWMCGSWPGSDPFDC